MTTAAHLREGSGGSPNHKFGHLAFCPTLSTQKSVNNKGGFVVPLDLPVCCLSGLSCSWFVLLSTCLFTQSVQSIRSRRPLMPVAPKDKQNPGTAPLSSVTEKERSTEVLGGWGLGVCLVTSPPCKAGVQAPCSVPLPQCLLSLQTELAHDAWATQFVVCFGACRNHSTTGVG